MCGVLRYRMLLGLVLSVLVSHAFCQLEIVNQWNLFQFDVPLGFPTNPNYTTASTVFNGLEIGWDKIYLSFPRFMPGAPLTFGYIPRVKPGRPGDLSPVIQVNR